MSVLEAHRPPRPPTPESFDVRQIINKSDDMKYYLLFYHVVDDYVSRRSAFREEHLRMAWEAHRRGELLLGAR
jgi:hypothetical protein